MIDSDECFAKLRYEDYGDTGTRIEAFIKKIEEDFEKVRETDIVVNNAMRIGRDLSETTALKYAVVELVKLNKYLTNTQQDLIKSRDVSSVVKVNGEKDGI